MEELFSEIIKLCDKYADLSFDLLEPEDQSLEYKTHKKELKLDMTLLHTKGILFNRYSACYCCSEHISSS